MGYWKAKVLPKIKKIFEQNGPKKAAAAEACKTFDEAKEQYSTEFEEKKIELQPKVVEIYEAAAVEIKTLVKEPKDAGLKKHSAGVQKFLDELVKIEFPGSKAVSEACTQFGPSYVSGPVSFVFEKVSTFIVTEEVTKDVEVAAPAETAKATEEETSTAASTVAEVKEKEIVIEAEPKKEEEPAPVAAPAPVEETSAAKVEEAPAAAPAAEPPKA